MTVQNPKIKAVVAIRNMVAGISDEWKELRSNGAEMKVLIDKVNQVYVNNTTPKELSQWEPVITSVVNTVSALQENMIKTVDKINAKDPNNLTELWDKSLSYSEGYLNDLNKLNELGLENLSVELIPAWKKDWELIFDKFLANQKIADASSLQLALIEEYSPEEIDDLTQSILNNMPMDYTEKEAAQYEEEYMAAYEDIKKEMSTKKNLWDRFLDVLAGGIQQTPAEKVMMQRWVNGEKGEL